MSSKEKDAKLEALMAQVNKKFGAGTVSNMNTVDNKVQRLSTGSLKLDAALSGGLGVGRIIEIYGPESSGKTTIALHSIAAAQAAGKTVAFIDMEHALDPGYANNLGVDMSDLFVSQPDYGEQALDILEDFVNSNLIDLIIVDSVAALTPKAELEGDMEAMTVGAQARLMSKALRKITPVANSNQCTIIFINQIRMKIGMMGYGSPETTTGGNALKFYASQRIDIRRIGGIKGKINGEEADIGNKVKIKIVKTKLGIPFRTINTEIYFGEGISKYAEILDLAIQHNIIKKAGAWFSRGDDKLGQGQEKVITKFKTEPKFFEEIRNEVLEKIKAIEEKHQQAEAEKQKLIEENS